MRPVLRGGDHALGKPARFIALFSLLVLLGFIAIGCQKHLVPEGPNCPGDAVIKVKKDGHVNKEKVKLDKRCKDVAFWVAEESMRKACSSSSVCPDLFEGMTRDRKAIAGAFTAKDWACFSGETHRPERTRKGMTRNTSTTRSW